MPQSARLPKSGPARERLREAQAAESQAVARYFALAQRAAAAAATYAEAQGRVADAAADVVAVSGAQRALILLGLDKSELRSLTASRSAAAE